MLAMVVAVATGTASRQLTDTVNAVVTAAVSVVIVRGLIRLLRERGVTVQAVAGALAIYLSIGLVFAWITSSSLTSTPRGTSRSKPMARKPTGSTSASQ